MRFPAGEELAAAMRALHVMRLARALAGWVGDEPIPIADGWQAPETKLDAARALGLVAEDGTLTDEITRRLSWIYEIAFHAGYLHTEHGAVHRHQGLDTATEQTDAQIRTAWDGALNALFAHGVEDLLPEAANPAPLDFHGIGNFPLLAMLEQHGTATVTELSDEIALGATEGMTPSAAEHAWAAWTFKHGDPTRGYLGLAEELGVLKIDGETATLTPLGTWAMLRQLHNAYLEHLPGSAELTPYQMLVCRLGMSDEAIRKAIAGFGGVKRRFTRTGEWNGVTVIDDYGHHPVEIAAVLKAARESTNGKIVAVVQPHRFTRLQSLFEEFCTCFNDADAVVVAEVYPAGEAPIEGIDRDHFVTGLRAHGHREVIPLPNAGELAKVVHGLAGSGDLVVCLGAGNITQWAYALPGELKALG